MLVSMGIPAQTSSMSNKLKSFDESYYFDMTMVFVSMPSLVLVNSVLRACAESIKKQNEITENLSKNISDNDIVKCNEKNKEKVQTK